MLLIPTTLTTNNLNHYLVDGLEDYEPQDCLVGDKYSLKKLTKGINFGGGSM